MTRVDAVVCGRKIGTTTWADEVRMFCVFHDFEPVAALELFFEYGTTLEVDYYGGTMKATGGQYHDLAHAIMHLPKVDDAA